MNHKWQKNMGHVALAFIAIATCYVTFSMPIIYVSNGYSERINWMFIVCLLFINTFRLFYAVQFTLATLVLCTRFDGLNASLKSFLSTPISVKQVLPKYFPIFRFGNLYHDLCNGVDLINDTFTLQLVFLFVNILVS